MIVITGATGQLGHSVVEQLLTRMPASQLVASVRDPSKAATLATRGVTVRPGDFDDPASLPPAFAGAEQVLIVSANKLGEEALRLHRNAIAGARAAGVRRLLYTSHMGARADSPFAPREPACGDRGGAGGERPRVHRAPPRLLCRKLPSHGRRRAEGG